MPQLGYSSSATPRHRPSEGSETRARRPTWVPWHAACPRPPELCARTQVCRTDVKASGCAQQDAVPPHTPRTVGLWCFSIPHPQSDGGQAAPWWSTGTQGDGGCDSAHGEMPPKRATSQFTKMEKEQKIY